MMRPLYREAGQQHIDRKGGNAGLWYDKFFDQWKSGESLIDGGKQRWVEGMTKAPVGGRQQLEEYCGRLIDLLERHGQRPLFYALESNFVTGLGREHPVENGFAWHPTLGTPYLPGSSIKGMVRAWAEQWEKADKAELKRIFGSESKDDREFRVGSVVFLDAILTRPVRLKADIITPHYAPYYQDATGSTPPADWHSPTPIPFLVVAAGASFLFGVLPRRKEDGSDCEKARKWLEQALEWTGAGAKTAVGYGRFALDTSARQAFEKERAARLSERQAHEEEERRRHEMETRTRGKSGLYRELYEASVEEDWREDKDAFSRAGVIEGWVDRLEANPDQDAVELLNEVMRLHYAGVLANPDAKKGKKGNEFKYKDRQRNFARRMLRLLEETE